MAVGSALVVAGLGFHEQGAVRAADRVEASDQGFTLTPADRVSGTTWLELEVSCTRPVTVRVATLDGETLATAAVSPNAPSWPFLLHPIPLPASRANAALRIEAPRDAVAVRHAVREPRRAGPSRAALYRFFTIAGALTVLLACELLALPSYATLVVLLTAISALPAFVLGITDHIGFDMRAYFYPGYQFMGEILARGRIPLWNPWVFCGVPFAANQQAQLFYPPAALAALAGISYPASALLLGIGHLALAGAGADRLMRSFGLSPLAGRVAGFGFALAPLFLLSGHPPMLAAYAWSPWLALVARGGLAPGWGAVATFHAMTAGHLQVTFYSLLGASLFLPVSRRRMACAMAGFIPGSLASSILLLPALELGAHSIRSAGLTPSHAAYAALPLRSALGWLGLQPRSLAPMGELGAPGAPLQSPLLIALGLLPLFSSTRSDRRLALRLILLGALGVLLSCESSLTSALLPARATIRAAGLTTLATALCGGLGVDVFARATSRTRAGMALGAALAGAMVLQIEDVAHLGGAIVALAVALLLVLARARPVALATLLLLLAVDRLDDLARSHPGADLAEYRVTGSCATSGRDGRTITFKPRDENAALLRHVPNASGYDPITPAPVAEVLAEIQPSLLPLDEQGRLGLPSKVSPAAFVTSGAFEPLRLLRVGRIVGPLSLRGHVSLPDARKSTCGFETKVLLPLIPRVWCIPEEPLSAGTAPLRARITGALRAAVKQRCAVEVEPLAASPVGLARGTVASSDEGRWLVLAEAAYPGWVFRIGGMRRRTSVYAGLYRAAQLLPGDGGPFSWSFEPWSYRLGAFVTLLAIAATGLVVTLAPDPRRRR